MLTKDGLLKTEDIFLKTKDGCTFRPFIEKTSVKQDLKLQVCSNFQMFFLHLSHMDPLEETSGGQELY